MAMLPTSQEAPGDDTTTGVENSKASFLKLPQELRDHIYSFLPLITDRQATPINIPPERNADSYKTFKQYFQLATTCRTMRNDIEKAFWSGKNIFHLRMGHWRTFPLSARALSYVKNVTLSCYLPGFRVFRGVYGLRVRIVEVEGNWQVQLHYLGVDRKRAESQSLLAGIKRELSDHGFITMDAIMMVENFRL